MVCEVIYSVHSPKNRIACTRILKLYYQIFMPTMSSFVHPFKCISAL